MELGVEGPQNKSRRNTDPATPLLAHTQNLYILSWRNMLGHACGYIIYNSKGTLFIVAREWNQPGYIIYSSQGMEPT